MLDVNVNLYKNGVLISGEGDSSGNDTAVLGKAVIGKMRLGKA